MGTRVCNSDGQLAYLPCALPDGWCGPQEAKLLAKQQKEAAAQGGGVVRAAGLASSGMPCCMPANPARIVTELSLPSNPATLLL